MAPEKVYREGEGELETTEVVDECDLVAQVELNIIYHLLMMLTAHNTCKTRTCLLFYYFGEQELQVEIYIN